jgi:hypothetical protein
MNEDLESVLTLLRNYVRLHGLSGRVSLQQDEGRIRITLLTEGRELWLGRRYYIVPHPTEEPQAYFELNDIDLSRLLALPSGVEARAHNDADAHVLFVCYSRRDEALVVPLVDLLRVTKTQVFRDRDDIAFGDQWRPTIDAAIESATVCLVFWCEHASRSAQMAREIDMAIDLGKRIVPVILDDSPLDRQLEIFHSIDMRAFKPHVQVETPTGSEAGPDATSLGRELDAQRDSTALRKAAAAYLRQQLADLLEVEPVTLIDAGRQLEES